MKIYHIVINLSDNIFFSDIKMFKKQNRYNSLNKTRSESKAILSTKNFRNYEINNYILIKIKLKKHSGRR